MSAIDIRKEILRKRDISIENVGMLKKSHDLSSS